MDFSLNEEQEAIRDLAGRILGERVPAERLRALEELGTWFDADVWREMGKAGLLGLALPEAHGGGGLGLIEACLVAEQVGRAVAPVPYIAVVSAGLALAEHGSQAQQSAHLPGLSDGSRLVTVALQEAHEVTVPAVPQTQATRTADGWRLEGEKTFVVAADTATTWVVPARTGETTSSVFLVDAGSPGASLQAERAVTGEPQWTLRLDGVEVTDDTVLGDVDAGTTVTGWIADRMTALICFAQTGVCEEALAITARYVSTREQFGARLGTFQAVGHRVADAYIDTEAIRLTAQQAAWRLSADVDAEEELMVAKFWAADGAQRVVHAAQHLHGGIGVDLDYPIHRYFRWAKVLELTLGGATPSLLRLGSSLVARPAPA